MYIGGAGNQRIRKVTISTGIITTTAGTGTSSYSGDGGAATAAELFGPRNIAFDSLGNYYYFTLFRVHDIHPSRKCVYRGPE